jgi:hypothetical protein
VHAANEIAALGVLVMVVLQSFNPLFQNFLNRGLPIFIGLPKASFKAINRIISQVVNATTLTIPPSQLCEPVRH